MYTDIHVRESVLYSDRQVRSFVFKSVINTKVCTEVDCKLWESVISLKADILDVHRYINLS